MFPPKYPKEMENFAVGHFKERKEEEVASVVKCSIISLTLKTPHFRLPTRVPSLSAGEAGMFTAAWAVEWPVRECRQGYRTSAHQPASPHPSKGPLGGPLGQGSLPRAPTSQVPRAHSLILNEPRSSGLQQRPAAPNGVVNGGRRQCWLPDAPRPECHHAAGSPGSGVGGQWAAGRRLEGGWKG